MLLIRLPIHLVCLVLLSTITVSRAHAELPDAVRHTFDRTCLDCHDGDTKRGGLDLSRIQLDPADSENAELWVTIHDRVRDGEMPPQDHDELTRKEIDSFLGAVSGPLAAEDRRRAQQAGRAKLRRLNRFEYENTLQTALEAPWLRVADMLPEDGTAHLFNKLGERLDVSHVQINRYIVAAEHAVRASMNAAAYPTTTKKYYAREDPQMVRNLWWRAGQQAPTRATIPLLGTTAQPEVIRKEVPVTVGDSDPETREREAMGVVSGTYTATLKYDFTQAHVLIDGRYRIRLRTYTFTAGPNGRAGGSDHGLTNGRMEWWRPDRSVAFQGERTEPITLYSLTRSGDSRWLATYDATPEPTITEHEVILEADETIRPDAGRLVRTRPGWRGNPNATRDGIPGFALSWLEVEGPLHDGWPPASYTALFGNLPFEKTDTGEVKVLSTEPERDASRLLLDFMRRAYRRPIHEDELKPFLGVYRYARTADEDFTDSMVAAFVAILCSPGFLYLDAAPGPLDDHALASRLSYFFWNGPPDEPLRTLANMGRLRDSKVLRNQADRLLTNPCSERFVNAFLDYWLDLRNINVDAPDATLYPDYYLDDQLTEASLFETRMFFKALLDEDRPVRELIDADFTFVNERLAQHYGLPSAEGVKLKRVTLPKDSPRGGLLTQASVLKVTANGTTTSPVLRGAWVMERLMGVDIPPPPSGIEAVEPDTRGATTIREQLDKHRSVRSCAGCHQKFDPAGFALESFDVAGGWRERYRSIGKEGEPAKGIGKNGHLFTFRHALPVDASGELPDGRTFTDVRALKRCLVADERALARNLTNRLVVYATGAPVRFGDRDEIEKILDQAAPRYGVRSLIQALVDSPLFREK